MNKQRFFRIISALFSEPGGTTAISPNGRRAFDSSHFNHNLPDLGMHKAVVHAVRCGDKLLLWIRRRLTGAQAHGEITLCAAAGPGPADASMPFALPTVSHNPAGGGVSGKARHFLASPGAIPLLLHLGLRPSDEYVWMLNPSGGHPPIWDLGQEVQTPGMAHALAMLLVPPSSKPETRADSDAARGLVFAVVLALNAAMGTHWTFRDLLSMLESPKAIVGLVERHQPSANLVARILRRNPRVDRLWLVLHVQLEPFKNLIFFRGTTCLSVWLLADVLRPSWRSSVLGADPAYGQPGRYN